MRQQKNDFTPVPLTKRGFKGRSYSQENLPDPDHNPAYPFVKGQGRVKTISSRELSGNEIGMLEMPVIRRSGPKRKLSTYG
jgi:hypothetical protein